MRGHGAERGRRAPCAPYSFFLGFPQAAAPQRARRLKPRRRPRPLGGRALAASGRGAHAVRGGPCWPPQPNGPAGSPRPLQTASLQTHPGRPCDATPSSPPYSPVEGPSRAEAHLPVPYATDTVIQLLRMTSPLPSTRHSCGCARLLPVTVRTRPHPHLQRTRGCHRRQSIARRASRRRWVSIVVSGVVSEGRGGGGTLTGGRRAAAHGDVGHWVAGNAMGSLRLVARSPPGRPVRLLFRQQPVESPLRLPAFLWRACVRVRALRARVRGRGASPILTLAVRLLRHRHQQRHGPPSETRV